MTPRDYLWLGLVVVLLLVHYIPTFHAQGVTRGAAQAALNGIEKDGVVWNFKTSTNGSVAPTILGILTPPHIEPTLPEQTGSLWVWCDGPTEATNCLLKVNLFGTTVVLADITVSLQ